MILFPGRHLMGVLECHQLTPPNNMVELKTHDLCVKNQVEFMVQLEWIDVEFAGFYFLPNWEDKAIGQGAMRNAGEDYWPWPGSSPMRAIKSLKLVKLLQVWKKKWFQWVHRACKHDTKEHGVHEVWPARRASFWWHDCPKVSFIYSTLLSKT
jgi:hypothetical protein